jgi:hypothetical protein
MLRPRRYPLAFWRTKHKGAVSFESTSLTVLGSWRDIRLQGASPVHPPSSGCLLLRRNLYNKGSIIQGPALRARREKHWHREAVRWGSP